MAQVEVGEVYPFQVCPLQEEDDSSVLPFLPFLSPPLPSPSIPSPPLPSPFSLTWHLSVAEEEVVERTLRNSFLVKWPRKDNSSLCRKKLIDLSLTYQKANLFFVVSLVHGTFGHKLSLHQTIDNRARVGIGNAHTQCISDVTSG